MHLSGILEWLEQIAPGSLQESYDNSGLMIGSYNDEIEKILVCLDINEEAMEYALNEGVQMIISHHPGIFKAIKVFSPDSQEGAILYKAILNGLAVYSLHTNYDSVEGGLTDCLAKNLGLEQVTVIKPYHLNDQHGLGRIGQYPAPILQEVFVELIKELLNISSIKSAGKAPDKIQKIALYNGSYDRTILPELIKLRPDVVLTGDLKYHDAQEIAFNKLFALDIGHYHSEIIFVHAVSDRLRARFPELQVLEFKGEDIFKTV